MNQKIQFNDIPNFTSKFDNLFISNSIPKIISEQQIQREFNEEKYKVLLNRLIAKDFNSIEELFGDRSSSVYFQSDNFYVDLNYKIRNRYKFLISEMIGSNKLDTTQIIEIGAGTGEILLNLSGLKKFNKCEFYGLELTENGRKCIKALSKYSNSRIKDRKCDLTKKYLESEDIILNQLVFTSYVLMYLPKIDSDVIQLLTKLKPKKLIFFEPTYDFLPNSIHRIFVQKYMYQNGYNINIAKQLIGEFQKQKKYKLTTLSKNLFGANPFLPASAFVFTRNNS